MRQHERQQDDEHQDGDHQSPCTGIDFAGHAALGVFDVALELVEVRLVALVAAHRLHPVVTGCAGGCRCRAARDRRPSCARGVPTGLVGVTGPGAAVSKSYGVGDQMVRRRAGDRGADDVAGPHVALAGGEVHQSAVAGAPGHPSRAASLRPSPVATRSSTLRADLGDVLLEGDPFLKFDQAHVALLHDGFRKLIGQFGRRGSWPFRVLERERAGESRALDHVEGGREVRPRSRRESRRSGRW